jgi:hypothetical protein
VTRRLRVGGGSSSFPRLLAHQNSPAGVVHPKMEFASPSYALQLEKVGGVLRNALLGAAAAALVGGAAVPDSLAPPAWAGIGGGAVTNAKALLRYALPIDNKPIRKIQKELEAISDELRVPGGCCPVPAKLKPGSAAGQQGTVFLTDVERKKNHSTDFVGAPQSCKSPRMALPPRPDVPPHSVMSTAATPARRQQEPGSRWQERAHSLLHTRSRGCRHHSSLCTGAQGGGAGGCGIAEASEATLQLACLFVYLYSLRVSKVTDSCDTGRRCRGCSILKLHRCLGLHLLAWASAGQ